MKKMKKSTRISLMALILISALLITSTLVMAKPHDEDSKPGNTSGASLSIATNLETIHGTLTITKEVEGTAPEGTDKYRFNISGNGVDINQNISAGASKSIKLEDGTYGIQETGLEIDNNFVSIDQIDNLSVQYSGNINTGNEVTLQSGMKMTLVIASVGDRDMEEERNWYLGYSSNPKAKMKAPEDCEKIIAQGTFGFLPTGTSGAPIEVSGPFEPGRYRFLVQRPSGREDTYIAGDNWTIANTGGIIDAKVTVTNSFESQVEPETATLTVIKQMGENSFFESNAFALTVEPGVFNGPILSPGEVFSQEVAPGLYMIHEIFNPVKWTNSYTVAVNGTVIPAPESYGAFPVEIGPGDEVVVSITNTEITPPPPDPNKGKIVVQKEVDAEDRAYVPANGFPIYLFKQVDNYYDPLDSNYSVFPGSALMISSLEPGRYFVAERDDTLPAGWSYKGVCLGGVCYTEDFNIGPFHGVILDIAADNTARVTFGNNYTAASTGSIIISKKVIGAEPHFSDNSLPYRIVLKHDEDSIYNDFCNDREILFDNLEPGNYTIQELDAPDQGYFRGDEVSYTIGKQTYPEAPTLTLTAGETIKVTVTNTFYQGYLIIDKDILGIGPNSFSADIYNADGTPVKTVSFAEGSSEPIALRPGSYYLIENSGNGDEVIYNNDKELERADFTIIKNETTTVNISNRYYAPLTVEKLLNPEHLSASKEFYYKIYQGNAETAMPDYNNVGITPGNSNTHQLISGDLYRVIEPTAGNNSALRTEYRLNGEPIDAGHQFVLPSEGAVLTITNYYANPEEYLYILKSVAGKAPDDASFKAKVWQVSEKGDMTPVGEYNLTPGQSTPVRVEPGTYFIEEISNGGAGTVEYSNGQYAIIEEDQSSTLTIKNIFPVTLKLIKDVVNGNNSQKNTEYPIEIWSSDEYEPLAVHYLRDDDSIDLSLCPGTYKVLETDNHGAKSVQYRLNGQVLDEGAYFELSSDGAELTVINTFKTSHNNDSNDNDDSDHDGGGASSDKNEEPEPITVTPEPEPSAPEIIDSPEASDTPEIIIVPGEPAAELPQTGAFPLAGCLGLIFAAAGLTIRKFKK